jgi:hypothetical protein
MRRWLLAQGEDPETADASPDARLCLERFVLSAVAKLAWPWSPDGRAPIPGAVYTGNPGDLAATTGMSAYAVARSLRALEAGGYLLGRGRVGKTGPQRWQLLDPLYDRPRDRLAGRDVA